METKARIHDISIDFESGKQVISLVCEKDIRGEYDRLKDKECRLKVVQYREGRSLDANAYFHVLVGKIAEVTDNSKVYIKNKLIAEYGQHEIINGSLVSLPLDNDIEVYDLEFCHLQPTASTTTNKAGKLFRINLVMRGSHTYNTKEMSELIKGTVAEAKELGIETATPQEIKEMEERWGLKIEKKSIIVDDMEHCKLCGSPYVEIHHCLHGTANRKKADKYNLVIPLCHEHHTGGKQSAHLNARYDLMYKKMAQKAFEEKIGTREEFIKEFGKSWL